jgi:SWI/SNF-related matrix-associated actin-dependent regulator 1 of chromatin subfamily A
MIPSKPRYDGTDRAWLVSINDARYPAGRDANWYVRAFSQWAVQMRFCSIVKEREVTEDINYDIPPMKPFVGEHYMLLQPYEYQLEGVQYAIEHKRCFFGDQPGLGKTLQAICAVVKAHKEAPIYGESFPVLVICPAALKVNWQREFKKFAGINAIILDDRNRQSWQSFYECKKSDGSPLCEVFITNYESLNKFFVRSVNKESKFTMKSIAFDQRVSLFRSVIIDESHKCKSSKTQQGKFVEGICKGKRYVFALTGTPVVNNNTDLIQQLKILGRLEDFGGYSRYVERYCDGPKQASNVKELNWRLWNTCFFRREKSKVLTQLPDKTRQYLTVDITTTKEYKAAEADMVKYLKKYKNASDAQVQKSMNGAVMVQMQLLKQISARGKIKAVCEFVHDVIDGGEKLILFGYLKEVVAELKKEFPKAVTVTGSDNVNQKQYAVDSFQNNPDCKLIILNFKSGGTGLTLTAASRVAFIEFPWTFSDCEQAEDRAHRNGQKNNVNCYYFLGKDTIDKYMYDVIQTKKNIANGVTGTDDQVEENMVNLAMDLFRDKL